MLMHDLANDGGYVALKRAAKNREGWRQRNDVKNLLYCRKIPMMMLVINCFIRPSRLYKHEKLKNKLLANCHR